jgi:hypothetical protein
VILLFKNLPLAVLLGIYFGHSTHAYEIPPREIEVKPYINVIFPVELVKTECCGNIVKDEAGLGLGLKIRNQVRGPFGLAIDVSFTDLEVTNRSMSTATIFTGGGYYKKEFSIGIFILECKYGVISIADRVRALFLPGLEYGMPVSDRARVSAEFGWPISNDWIYGYSIKENYKTFALSVGGSITF